jgi:hypothetical protein
MRDLDSRQLTRLPERIRAAQRGASVDDEHLCRLMGWHPDDLEAIRSGERVPTPGEMRGLYGVFGKSSQGTLQTRWYNGARPPLRPADWVVLGEPAEAADAQRLQVENRELRRRIEELERELDRGRALLASTDVVLRRLLGRVTSGD